MGDGDFTGFGKGLQRFFAELEANNSRDWFQANKARYEADVREPARAFVRAMAPRLASISKHFVANDKKVGGSMMRINRDVRFSKDKSPYNTNVSMRFLHDDKSCPAGVGYYFRVTATEIGLGAGVFTPPTPELNRIRAAMDANQSGWKKARDDAKQRAAWGGLFTEDALKRPPKGYDKEHPLVEDLKLKNVVLFADLPKKAVTAKDLVDQVAERFVAAKPLVRFVAKGLDLPF